MKTDGDTRYRRGPGGRLLDEPPTPAQFAWAQEEYAQLRADLRETLELYRTHRTTAVLRLAATRSADIDAFKNEYWGLLGGRAANARPRWVVLP